jgi:hypothetical protein
MLDLIESPTVLMELIEGKWVEIKDHSVFWKNPYYLDYVMNENHEAQWSDEDGFITEALSLIGQAPSSEEIHRIYEEFMQHLINKKAVYEGDDKIEIAFCFSLLSA